METLFGISQYKATEYPFGTTMEMVASANDFIIKRIESRKDYLLNYRFDFKIFNKNLEPYIIRRNTWSLGDFQSNQGWNPGVLNPIFRDVTNLTKFNYALIVTEVSFSMLGQPRFGGRGHEALNSILEQFLDVSEYKNWPDYIRKKYDIIIDEQSFRNLTEDEKEEGETITLKEEVEIKKDNELLSLKEELEKLKLENDQLKAKLKQLEAIIAKANRILQRLSKKSGK